MNPPRLHRRLMAQLVAAIHGIAQALLPVIDAVATQPTCPWHQRARLADRFNAIVRELLALTARIRPASLSRAPTFPTLNNAPPRPIPRTQAARPAPPRPPCLPATAPAAPAPAAPAPAAPAPAGPAKLLSARQLAQRLANLLRQLECLAAEAGAVLAAPIRGHIARARTIAGCAALPTANTAWERAG